MSVESWKAFFDIGTIVLLLLTGVFAAGIFFTGNIINDRQAEQLRHFDKELTSAKIELGKQQERAAIAERHLENMKDRIISPDQEKILIASLSGVPSGPVEIWWTATDTDSFGLATKMVEIFKKAGWSTVTEHFAAGGRGNGFFMAVHDPFNAPSHALSIKNAYRLAGIELFPFAKPETPADMVQIFIGHKTPPQ